MWQRADEETANCQGTCGNVFEIQIASFSFLITGDWCTSWRNTFIFEF
jgi:hypothetical protein